MKRLFKLGVLVAVLALGALVVPPAPARAGDGREKYIEWYSDATKTEVVGWRQEYCGGTSDSWGYQTSYRETWWGNECLDGSGGWGGTFCYYQSNNYCPAYCLYCV